MPVSVSDLRSGARLATHAVTGVTDIAEAMHAAVASPFGRPRRARGLTGWIYRLVRVVTRSVGRTVDRALGAVDGIVGAAPDTPAREAVVSAVNGVLGDHLVAIGDPLAIPMQIRHGGRRLVLTVDALARDVPDARGVLLVQVHGICMHDGQWGAPGHDPGAVLAGALGATRVGVRYNSGRHIAESGRDLAAALDALVSAWPVAVHRLVVVGHSMGGLVARSAFHHAEHAGHDWPRRAAALVMLGSPHHGAPLERIGNAVDALLEASRYAAPLARVGQIRSAGVTDLRYGNVHDDDWTGRGRFEHAPDARRPVPLPDGVACFVVAATTAPDAGVRDETIGDGLVPLQSALGRHADPARDLAVPPERQAVFRGMTHFDLLRRPEVTDQLVRWLSPRSR